MPGSPLAQRPEGALEWGWRPRGGRAPRGPGRELSPLRGEVRLRVPPWCPGPLRLSKDNFWELRSALRCSPLDQSVSWLVPSGGTKLMAVPGTPPRAPPLASRPASAAARTAPGQLPGYRPDSSRTGPPTGRCPYSCRPSRARPAVSPMQTPHVAPRRARSSTKAHWYKEEWMRPAILSLFLLRSYLSIYLTSYSSRMGRCPSPPYVYNRGRPGGRVHFSNRFIYISI